MSSSNSSTVSLRGTRGSSSSTRGATAAFRSSMLRLAARPPARKAKVFVPAYGWRSRAKRWVVGGAEEGGEDEDIL